MCMYIYILILCLYMQCSTPLTISCLVEWLVHPRACLFSRFLPVCCSFPDRQVPVEALAAPQPRCHDGSTDQRVPDGQTGSCGPLQAWAAFHPRVSFRRFELGSGDVPPKPVYSGSEANSVSWVLVSLGTNENGR